MTKEETESLFRYAMNVYPYAPRRDQEYSLQIWFEEFKDEDREEAFRAFRDAMTESPEWMPTIPKIKLLIRQNRERIKQLSPDEEFRLSHHGKSEAEWKAMVEWERSPDGIRKLRAYKEQLQSILGVNSSRGKHRKGE